LGALQEKAWNDSSCGTANEAQAQKDLEKAVSEWGREPSVEPAPPALRLPDPTPVNQVKEFDWEQGVGPNPLSESILRALAQEIESARESSQLIYGRASSPLPSLRRARSPQKYLGAASKLSLFKGKLKCLTVDVMVIEGDQDLLLKGSKGRRISAAAGPSL
jgi:hypothetical protein